MLCHLSSLTGFIGIPFGHLLGPFLFWLLKRQEIPEVDSHGKESLNFQISMTLYGLVVALLCFVFIGFLLIPVILLADVILVIIASVKASQGEPYRYPFCLRLIK